MNKNKTHLVVITDVSGSMILNKTKAESGINELLQSQKDAPGECSISFYEFSNDVSLKFEFDDIKQLDAQYVLEPSGSTSLYDAVCTAITETGNKLAALDEADRPGLVLVLIATDGEENTSKKFHLSQMRSMIQHQTDVYKWQFNFICADPTVASQAVNQYGIQSALNYGTMDCAYRGMAAKFSRMRSESTSGQIVDNAFSSEEANMIQDSSNSHV